MMLHRWLIILAALLAITLPAQVHSVEVEDARTVGCLPKTADKTTESACATCHKSEKMEGHHPVGTRLEQGTNIEMPLTAKNEIVCITCHNLSQLRYDKERWKASSLFDRLFRNEKQHKTYFLSMKNDKGQLCLTCH